MQSGVYLFDLENLRAIGFKLWPRAGRSQIAALPDDEYDGYLMQAAGYALRGASAEDLTEYLLSCCHVIGAAVDVAAANHAAGAIVASLRMARAVV